MVEVNSPTLKQCLHFLVIATAAVNGILAGVVLVSCSGYYKLRVGDKFEGIWARLKGT